VTSAAIYARVSSARQKKDETIGSQTAALREHAAQARLEVPEEWVFEDEGHSGATLVRPALEALRDLAAQGCVDVVLVYSPDRLARKFAYQALLLEEFARAGVRVEFVKGPRGDSPEDQLLIQFQGMFAEYEKAQLMERYRRGKAHRARCGSVNVLGGAPFGYRYVSKTADSGASYEIVDHEAVIAAELFRRYADDGASIADLTRWLTSENVPTRTGKARWDRSVVWGMLRNPAYAGTAVFGKTQVLQESPGLNRRARLEGRSVPRASKTVDRPREEWIEIPVPAIVTAGTFQRAAQRLADNKRYAARNTKVPSLLQGLAACSACGYGYYRTSARTTSRKIYYYRCLGSDDYRYEGGRVCGNKPVRADYLDEVVWDHVTGLLADPALIRAEISKRLEVARTSDPVTSQRTRLQAALAKAAASITAMIEAYSEQLITIDELRARMPHLRARETSLRGQLDAVDAQAADRDAYLKLADGLEGFLAQLRGNAATATVEDRQRVLRLLVKDVLIGPEKITIRHRIPARPGSSAARQRDPGPDTEGDHQPGYLLRWGRDRRPLRGTLRSLRPRPVLDDSRGQPLIDQPQNPFVRDPVPEELPQPDPIKLAEKVADVRVEHPVHLLPPDPDRQRVQRVMRASARPEPVGEAQEVRLVNSVQYLDDSPLDDLVLQRGDAQRPQPPVRLRDVRPARWPGPVAPAVNPVVQVPEVGHQVLPVVLPRHPVHARCGLRAQRPVGHHQPLQADMVQQRREPRFLVPSCYLTHTVQPAWRIVPGTASGMRCAVRVPLGRSPFLHRLRRRLHGLVRQLRRYYGTV
jgi:site-specific DNA recombinase